MTIARNKKFIMRKCIGRPTIVNQITNGVCLHRTMAEMTITVLEGMTMIIIFLIQDLTIIGMMHLGINLMMGKDIGIIIIGTMHTSPIGTIPINLTDQLRHPGYNIKVII